MQNKEGSGTKARDRERCRAAAPTRRLKSSNFRRKEISVKLTLFQDQQAVLSTTGRKPSVPQQEPVHYRTDMGLSTKKRKLSTIENIIFLSRPLQNKNYFTTEPKSFSYRTGTFLLDTGHESTSLFTRGHPLFLLQSRTLSIEHKRY